jgi:hypothetical protein
VAVQSLAVVTLLALPAAWVLRGNSKALAAAQPGRRGRHARPCARALADRSYRLLAAGFFVCGFHVAFLATHLPGVVASCQLPPEVGAWALAVLGLFNIVGSLAIGWAIGFRGGCWRMKSMLSLIYATRALAVADHPPVDLHHRRHAAERAGDEGLVGRVHLGQREVALAHHAAGGSPGGG